MAIYHAEHIIFIECRISSIVRHVYLFLSSYGGVLLYMKYDVQHYLRSCSWPFYVTVALSRPALSPICSIFWLPVPFTCSSFFTIPLNPSTLALTSKSAHDGRTLHGSSAPSNFCNRSTSRFTPQETDYQWHSAGYTNKRLSLHGTG